MKIVLASDHGGFTLKEEVREYLEQQGLAFDDIGTDSQESVDYPVYGRKAAEAVACGD